ncbi:MAG TPA: sugar ABC transporter substrate-binding protein [Actinophytocola sp.]|uniref:sugar ABC transporter substrate-binding protein n=1 Tax=Actinophytocola sp. TaxID=1872138 RepID=UPI002DBE5CE3|nr:sugar ABC transporter substrate-binding protein [Actinophytocola sp.]HEU5472288.1 sugar ABC transporter substrate-binding protein [Actinophytocola sp.]
MTSRRAGAVGAAMLGLIMVAGCGRDDAGGSGDAAAPVAEGAATGEITVWAMGTEGEKLSVLAKDFEAANPQAKVNVTAIPWDAAHDKIATAIAGRQTPDASLVGTTFMAEFAKSGALDPTPSVIDGKTFFEGGWDTTVVDGTSYGVPWYVETRLLYYRSDLATKAGQQAPGNWADLTAFATAMKQNAGAKWGINLQAGGKGAWQTFMPFAWQAGASITDDAAKQFTLDSPDFVKALEYYKSFFDAQLTPSALLRPGELEQGFVDGSFGAFFSGPWHMSLIKEQGGPDFTDKWAVARMPKEAAGTSFVGGGNLAVFKDAKNRDAAWKFVQYLTRPEVQVKWYGETGDLPSVRSAWQDQKLSGDPLLKTFGDQLNEAKSPPAIATWEQVATVIDTKLEEVVKGVTTPADAARAMQAEATSIGV